MRRLALITYNIEEPDGARVYDDWIREFDYPAFRQNPNILEYSCFRIVHCRVTEPRRSSMSASATSPTETPIHAERVSANASAAIESAAAAWAADFRRGCGSLNENTAISGMTNSRNPARSCALPNG